MREFEVFVQSNPECPYVIKADYFTQCSVGVVFTSRASTIANKLKDVAFFPYPELVGVIEITKETMNDNN